MPIRIPSGVNVLPQRFKTPLYTTTTIDTPRAEAIKTQRDAVLDKLEEESERLERWLYSSDPDIVSKTIEDLKINNKEARDVTVEARGKLLEEVALANNDIQKRNDRNEAYARAALSSAVAIGVQVANLRISTIGTRTGNVIGQERLQLGIRLGSQLVGVATSALVNPVLAATGAVALAANYIIKDQQVGFQRERISIDNNLRLNVLGGIAERGNR